MADNYLERKMEELRSGNAGGARMTKNLDALAASLHRVTAFDQNYIVHPFQLQSIISIWKRIPGGGLAFAAISSAQAQEVLRHLDLSAALPSDGLPNAFIAIGCDEGGGYASGSTGCGAAENKLDSRALTLGMAAQALMLKAAELGLSSLIITHFPASQIAHTLGLGFTPALLLAIGRKQ